MTRYRRVARGSAGLAGLMLFLAPSAVSYQDAEAAQACCFRNTRYAGVCVVEPGEGETCASILGYLNNPQSQGKAYCGSTSIRGGWRQAACPKASPPRGQTEKNAE